MHGQNSRRSLAAGVVFRSSFATMLIPGRPPPPFCGGSAPPLSPPTLRTLSGAMTVGVGELFLVLLRRAVDRV